MSYAEGMLNVKGRLSGALKAIDTLKRVLLIIVGTAAVIVGIVGIFLPVLPTTPFLLLAATCYAASSKRFYSWLMANRLFGAHLKNYREGRGMSAKVKTGTLSLMWATMGLSIYFFIESLPLKLLLLGIAIAVSIHVLMIKTMTE
jgi:uncharacterized membrane protein YbaN (DUF454 family)